MASLSEFYRKGYELCWGKVVVGIFSGSVGQALFVARCKNFSCVLGTPRSEMAGPVGVDRRRRPPSSATQPAKCTKRVCLWLLHGDNRKRRSA